MHSTQYNWKQVQQCKKDVYYIDRNNKKPIEINLLFDVNFKVYLQTVYISFHHKLINCQNKVKNKLKMFKYFLKLENRFRFTQAL